MTIKRFLLWTFAVAEAEMKRMDRTRNQIGVAIVVVYSEKLMCISL